MLRLHNIHDLINAKRAFSRHALVEELTDKIDELADAETLTRLADSVLRLIDARAPGYRSEATLRILNEVNTTITVAVARSAVRDPQDAVLRKAVECATIEKLRKALFYYEDYLETTNERYRDTLRALIDYEARDLGELIKRCPACVAEGLLEFVNIVERVVEEVRRKAEAERRVSR